MDKPLLRVFIDSNVLISGIASLTGASAAILNIGESNIIKIVLCQQVLIESDRNIEKKFPALIYKFRDFIKKLNPDLALNPTVDEIKKILYLINQDDAPILACAIKSRIDYLVSLNIKHFKKNRIEKDFTIKVVTPGEFLYEFRKSISQNRVIH